LLAGQRAAFGAAMSPTSAALAAQQPSPSAKAFAIPVDNVSIALSVAGDPSRPALLLLHGWPHSRALFHGVLDELSNDFYVLAPDLPAIGDSRGAPAASDKATLAHILLTAAERAGAKEIIVAGVDVGGMTAFAAARDHGRRIAGAVVMNTVIPGVEPWERLISDPQVWHFAFHALPGLPEALVHGRKRVYFDYFHDVLAGNRARIPRDLRDAFAHAYIRPEALKAGFDWYRALEADARRNAGHTRIDTPVLYVQGDAGGHSIEPYLEGLKAVGVENLGTRVVADCGELIPVEKPAEFTGLLKDFAALAVSSAS
jgi:pimeloyl-ACP methyl ester carboxylesterase